MRQAIITTGAVVLVFGFGSLSQATAKGRVATFGPDTIALQEPLETGKWLSKVQQVFDPETRQLQRRRYEVWARQPQLDLDFVWQPADPRLDRPGRVAGRGRLIWRQRGKPSYDRTGIVSEYQGEMRDGRPHGQGRYLERHGVYYEGDWHDGRMHGAGKLKLASGGEYEGTFQHGKAHGTGQFIDVVGEIYEGPFQLGRKHGRGKTTLPNGRSYSSIWTNGVETPDSKRTRYAQRGRVFAGGSNDIRLGITVDRRLPRISQDDARSMDSRPGDRDLWYAASNRRNAVVIQPASRRFMSVWKGNAPIHILEEEDEIGIDNFGVFSLGRGQLVPLEIVLHVQNRSSRRLFLKGGYVDVESSELDAQPALQIASGTAFLGNDGMPERTVENGFFIENFGWGPAVDVNVRYGFYNQDNKGLRSGFLELLKIRQLDRSAPVDVRGGLLRAGIRRGTLGEPWRCRTSNTPAGCLREARGTGRFGSLAKFVNVTYGNFGLGIYGEVSYRWKTASGEWRRRTSTFLQKTDIGFIENLVAEEGEGGRRTVITKKELRLKVGQSNYRLPFSFRKRVPPGTSRLVIRLGARKASQHKFRIVLQTSGGRNIRSRPIELTYFWPRWIRRSPNF